MTAEATDTNLWSYNLLQAWTRLRNREIDHQNTMLRCENALMGLVVNQCGCGCGLVVDETGIESEVRGKRMKFVDDSHHIRLRNSFRSE